MRAYQLPKGGAGIDALAIVDRPTPKPLYRQVLVKVVACSLNYRDLGIVRGTYRMPVRENVIPLSDGAGEVVEVGPGVTRVKAGDKVAGCFFQRWAGGEPSPTLQASALGGALDGMLAEFAVLEEDGVVKIPDHLSLEEGATLPCAGVTAWDAIMNHAKLIAGQSVLLQGTGGVSIFGLQLAHAMGIVAIVTSSSDEKLARAKALGAAFGINYKTTPEWDKAAVEFTGGRGVDHVLEVGGKDTLTRSFGAIRLGGKISIIGSVSGGATELNPGLIFLKRANVQGISVGSMQMFEAMNAAIAANEIKPAIDRVFGFDEVKAAFHHMAAGAHFGKIVVRIA
ncbi:MAG: NAD(P)-dependent alcohol dehydrogenase [Xanthobacteraceae bacterium]|nr:NAD(P)-dependent alcohol dehydrogenase [Xanthobacteraceae bacterium]